jgi:ABC transport system ATP-binding/permease protein
MAIVSFREVCASYGGPLLLENANLNIERGERICLLGRNGTGKSTLLKLITGEMEPVAGLIEFQRNLKVAGLKQEVPGSVDDIVFDVIATGVGEQGRLLREYHEISHRIAHSEDTSLVERLSELSGHIEAAGAWQINQKIETVLSMMSLDADEPFARLSAGLKRRVMLARSIVDMPDLLLLDEPTNHLDIDSIRWLEDYLIGSGVTMLFVTHDRSFLRRLSSRIIEIDRGRLLSFDCGYDEYLERKEQILKAEAAHMENFDKKLAEEEVWIRKGIQGRRTRNEGRVRALQSMRQARYNRRTLPTTAKMTLQQASRSGELVAEAKGLSFSYEDGNPLVDNLTTTITRGDRIGVLGPNGIGKTTLLNLLLGKLKPDSGTLRLGTNLEIAYFDQLHNQLDENKSVADNIADGYKNIQIDGKPRNIIGYLRDFLFLPERAKSLVSSLSGGERSRLLLARLFAKPSNVLVLDEPTNNLDIETLELLEELLGEYNGTILTVSHDREFLNNTATGMLVFQGEGKIKEYVGGYDDFLRQVQAGRGETKAAEQKPSRQQRVKPQSKKLSFNEKKEMDALPVQIEQTEELLADLHKKMASPQFYKSPTDEISTVAAKAAALEAKLEELYERWQQLDK